MTSDVSEPARIQRDLAQRAARGDDVLDCVTKDANANSALDCASKHAKDGAAQDRVSLDAEDAMALQTRASIASSQFLRFLLVGGFAAAVNFGSRIVLSLWLPYTPAIVIAYLLGLTTAFLLNRRYVFTEATNRLHDQIFWFVAVNAVALAQTLLVSLLLADYLLPRLGITWHPETLAHAIGVVTPIFTSYVGHKRLSFSARA